MTTGYRLKQVVGGWAEEEISRRSVLQEHILEGWDPEVTKALRVMAEGVRGLDDGEPCLQLLDATFLDLPELLSALPSEDDDRLGELLQGSPQQFVVELVTDLVYDRAYFTANDIGVWDRAYLTAVEGGAGEDDAVLIADAALDGFVEALTAYAL